MKTIDGAMIILLFFYATGANAQSDYSAEFQVQGFPNIIGMELDFDLGARYIAAHGALINEDEEGDFKIPIYGSCFLEETTNGENALTCLLTYAGQPLLFVFNIDVGAGGLSSFDGDGIDATVTVTQVM